MKNFLEVIFPSFCIWCKTSGDYLCAACKKELKPHPERCPFCHKISPHYQTCIDCRIHQKSIAGIMIAFQYTTTIKKLILALKYYHKKDIAVFLAQRLILLMQTNPALMHALHEHKLIITYVPSHRRRRRFVKGYNQSQLLAREVAVHFWLSIRTLICKKSSTRSQTSLTRAQRLTNLSWSFTLARGSDLPPDTTVLIVDDITTTGATLTTLADLLRQHFPDVTIRGVVVGRHGN